MKKHRILCLTDHGGHNKENSLYAIVSAMAQHPLCHEMIVASRSAKNNSPFFHQCNFERIHGIKVDKDFNYESAKKSLHENILSLDTAEFDIILLRLPRPTSDRFLNLLELHFSSTCIINKPTGIIKCSNKAVLLNFPEVCPPIKLCHSIDEILSFSHQYQLVLKPLKEYGGKGLLRINANTLNDGKHNHNTMKYLESIKTYIQDEGYLAMKYLKNVNQGDKRLIVVGGEILAASLRLPAKGSWLCNVAMGGKSIASKPNQRELEIVKTINPFLKQHGILIYGVDTLVDDNGNRTLSEINTLSVGGFTQAQRQTGKPIIISTIDKIFDYAHSQLK